MREEKRKGQAAQVARARALLSTRVAWSEGYPLPRAGRLLFQSLTGARAVCEVDRELLRRTRRALSDLTRGESAPHLAELVDDPLAFGARTERVLDALAEAVHDRGPLPSDLGTLGARLQQLGLTPLTNALSWATGGDALLARTTQRWLRGHADTLAQALALDPGPRMLLTLVALWHESRRGLDVSTLLALFALPEAHTANLEGRAEHVARLQGVLRKLSKGWEVALPEAPARTTLAGLLHDWSLGLRDLSLAEARRGLRLLELTELSELLRERAACDARVARSEARLAQLHAARHCPDEALRALKTELSVLHGACPHGFAAHMLLLGLTHCARQPRHFAGLCALLELLPASHDGQPLRASVVCHVAYSRHMLSAEHLDAWLTLLGLHLGQRRDVELARWLGPVHSALNRQHDAPYRCFRLAEDLAEHVGKSTRAAPFAQAWSQLARTSDEVISDDRLRLLFALVALTDSAQQGLALLQALPLATEEAHFFSLPTLYQLAEGEPEELSRIVSVFIASSCQDLGLDVLVALFARAGALQVLRRMLLEAPRRVLALARPLAELSPAARAELPLPHVAHTTESAPDWAARYPSALHDSLSRLEHVEHDAEAVAGRLLGDVFPDRARLKQELRVLRARLAKAGDGALPRLEARRAALERRLRERPRASLRKLENLSQKLLDRADRSLFEGFQRELEARLEALSLRRLGLEQPVLPAQPKLTFLLVALGELSEGSRRLARDLLLARSGPEPWDLRERHENRAFLDGLSAQGIDSAPWLERDEGRVCIDPSGRQWTLRFAHDPLDVLRMGEHFDTCLSPGSFNFFSAVTNAADINKRVLFAYNEQGGVVGRCLFALTSSGAMLVFHPYAHEHGAAFATMVADVARELAARMGTAVARAGSVPKLLAASWYDDGPRDLTRSFPAFDAGSALRSSLLHLPLEGVLATLEQACTPLGLNAVTLPIVLHLGELDTRPELALLLLPAFERARHLALHTRLRMFTLLVFADRAELATRLCRQDELEAWVQLDGRVPALEHIVEIAPTRVLLALSRTRTPRRLARHEETPERLWWTILALLALKRRGQASRLFALLEERLEPNLRARRKQRLAELG